MDINKYEVEITQHVYLRALQRNIDIDELENFLNKSKVFRFGKHGVKFVNIGSKRTIVCVGHIVGTKIKIFTIEKK